MSQQPLPLPPVRTHIHIRRIPAEARARTLAGCAAVLDAVAKAKAWNEVRYNQRNGETK